MQDRKVELSKPEKARPRLRLEFLDGMRGLAAFYVVLFHLTEFVGPGLSASERALVSWMHYGHFAVCVFIVLSGYCLMLPVARSADGRLRGGFGGYLKRRAWRILPPYYAALAFSLLMLAAPHLLKVSGGGAKQDWQAAFAPGVLLSHLTLTHNLRYAWVYGVNSPLWSVATEWQIYFVFPALLLPLWRKFGLVAVILAGFAIGLAPQFLLPEAHNLAWACPWFLGLFALGMAAAVIGFAEDARLTALQERAPWGTLALILSFAAIGTVEALGQQDVWITDTLAGLAAFSLILYCAQAAVGLSAENRPAILRLLESRLWVAVGTFSYSLYLTHMPLAHKFGALRVSPHTDLLLRLGVGAPLCLGVAYLFHLAVERRFMSVPARLPHARELRPEVERAALY